MEKNKSQELISQIDIETDKTRNKVADILSWFFSNLFSLLFPVGAVFFIEIFEKSGTFDFKSNYSEMLMVAISKWLLIASFVIGLICEIRKKESDRL